jgi:hypothetical protein
MKPQAHLEGAMANRSMEGSVVAMFNVRKDIIPCHGNLELYILRISQ